MYPQNSTNVTGVDMAIKQEQNSLGDSNCERVLSMSWVGISGDMPGERSWVEEEEGLL